MEDEERPRKVQKQEQPASDQPSPRFENDTTPATENGQSTTISAQSNQDPQALSKNQQKKLRRKQAWEDARPERAAKRREKSKARRQRNREARLTAEANGEPAPVPPKRQDPPVQLPITLILDCSFDDLMRENEMISLGSQLTRCYSDNKRSRYMSHLAVSSFSGHLKTRFETTLSSQYLNWAHIRFLAEDYVETAKQAVTWMSDKSNRLEGPLANLDSPSPTESNTPAESSSPHIVYLTSDSDTTLTRLSPYTTYVIGGLVDKNRYKGLCYKRACERGIKTAKLPIGEYLQMATRQVLTTNHVVEIMLHWLELGDWGEAFMKVIPKRKGGTLKATDGETQEDELATDDVDDGDHGDDKTSAEFKAPDDEVLQAADKPTQD